MFLKTGVIKLGEKLSTGLFGVVEQCAVTVGESLKMVAKVIKLREIKPEHTQLLRAKVVGEQ